MDKKKKMKNILILLGIVLGIAVFATSCKDSLKSKSAETKKENETIMDSKNVREIYFAGGCFWGVEAYFEKIDGVKEVSVGGGRQLKRLRPAPQGRGYRIRKRSNHVTLVVDSINNVNN